MSTRGTSWGGRPPARLAPTWRWTRWRWPSGRAAGSAWTASSTTWIAGCSIWRSATRSVSPTPAWRRPRAPAGTATITLSPNRQRALQDGGDSRPRTLAGTRRRRVRHPRVRRLVQPAAAPRGDRHDPSRRVRGPLRSSGAPSLAGSLPITRASMKPGAVHTPTARPCDLGCPPNRGRFKLDLDTEAQLTPHRRSVPRLPTQAAAKECRCSMPAVPLLGD